MNAIRNEVKEQHEWAVRCLTVVLHALASLSAGHSRQKTVHRLRTHLRRLQAYLELVGEDRSAQIMAKCVSRLSFLRTLQVFERYLSRHGASKSDVRRIKNRVRKRWAKLDRKQVYRKIERCVRRHALPPIQASPDWMAERMERLRREHANALHALISDAVANPRRKTLHALRLRIKSIRYQEEWALDQAHARPDLVHWLERAQSVLGDYEERAEFRKLARTLSLKSYQWIVKDWRRARKRAREVPEQLSGVVEELAGRRLRLVRPEPRARNASLSNLRHAVGR